MWVSHGEGFGMVGMACVVYVAWHSGRVDWHGMAWCWLWHGMVDVPKWSMAWLKFHSGAWHGQKTVGGVARKRHDGVAWQ